MGNRSRRGFTLLEMVCVLAIVGLMASVLLPVMPRATSRSRLESCAVEIATLLKGDRNAAMSRGDSVATRVDAAGRRIASGASRVVVELPGDVRLDAVLPQTCGQQAARSTIRFFADGSSCGGSIALRRLEWTYAIEVNWLTGRVEIVAAAIH
ncbi:MAG: prepilin-type N-terminal cleavage/methylation domain-containing protein [Alphaproteobacteria bacterium]|nr:prepilin-type N-terminal cleavage/methylation domain-containing protein [Alphaproteobacteria bacterium]